MSSNENNYFENINYFKAYILGGISCSLCLNNNDILLKNDPLQSFLLDIFVKNINEKSNVIQNEPFGRCKVNLNKNFLDNMSIFLSINYGLDQSVPKIPDFENDTFKLMFLRGYCDANSEYVHNNSEYLLYGNSDMLSSISSFLKVPCEYNKTHLLFTGVNTLDFLSKIYEPTKLYFDDLYKDKLSKHVLDDYNFNIKLYDNYKIYENLRLAWKRNIGVPKFKYVLTSDKSIKPQKNRESDAGYDLHLIEKIEEKDGVYKYDTGIKIKPEFGYYCELVGRSSIAKTGYMLANNIGIIDANYTGNIIVGLVKISPHAKDLELPIKLVQIIPRVQISIDMEQVDSLEETLRNDEGGLGSKNLIK